MSMHVNKRILYRIEQEAEPQALLTRAAMLVTYGRIMTY